MIERARSAGIRVLESSGIEKLLNLAVAKPIDVSVGHYDLARVKNDLQQLFFNFHTVAPKSEIILDLTGRKCGRCDSCNHDGNHKG